MWKAMTGADRAARPLLDRSIDPLEMIRRRWSESRSRSPEEPRERGAHLVGRFLADEVPARDTVAMHGVRPLAPSLNRLRLRDAVLLTPKHEYRRVDPLVAAIGFIGLTVRSRARAIVFATRANRFGLTKARTIVVEALRIEAETWCGPRLECPTQEKIGIASDQRLRQRTRLRQKTPVVRMHGRRSGHVRPDVARRYDVENRQTRDNLRMVEREAIRDAGASIVTGDRKPLETESSHGCDLIECNGSLAVATVCFVRCGLVGTAVTLSIVQATKPLRRATEVVVGWAAAWVGCKLVGAGGAAIGTAAAPGPGTAAGGLIGCVIGGYGGYRGGVALGGEVYDWGEEAYFAQLPTVVQP